MEPILIQNAAVAKAKIDSLIPAQIQSREDCIKSLATQLLGKEMKIGKGEVFKIEQREKIPQILGKLFHKALSKSISHPRDVNDIIDRIKYAKPALSDEQYDTLMARALDRLNDLWSKETTSLTDITDTLSILHEKIGFAEGETSKKRLESLNKLAQNLLTRKNRESTDPSTAFIIDSLAALQAPADIEKAFLKPQAPPTGHKRKIGHLKRDWEQALTIKKAAVIVLATLAGAGGLYALTSPTATQVVRGGSSLVQEGLHDITYIPSYVTQYWQDVRTLQTDLHELENRYLTLQKGSPTLEEIESIAKETDTLETRVGGFFSLQEQMEVAHRAQILQTKLKDKIATMEAEQQTFKKQADSILSEIESFKNECNSAAMQNRTIGMLNKIESTNVPSQFGPLIHEIHGMRDKASQLTTHVRGFLPYFEKERPSIGNLVPDPSVVLNLQEAAQENELQSNALLQVATNRDATMKVKNIEATAARLAQTAKHMGKSSLVIGQARAAIGEYTKLTGQMPAMNENKAILKDIQDINKNLQKRTTPEQAQMLNTSIEVRVKMLESRSALYKELAQAASALKEYAATTEDQMKLQQRAARFEKAAKDWELSAREARQLQETGRKLMAQSQPPLQEQARVAPPSPTLVQLQDSLVNVESAIKEIKQTNPEALITRAELAFKEMGEKLKTWTTPNEANALWQKTQSTLNEVQQRISTLYPKAETPMQEAYELVNKVTSHTHPGDPEWDQTVHLADQVSTLITRQNELEKALDRVSTLLSSAERLADEYNSPTDQLTDVFLRTSEDNAWIASKVSGLWNWVSSFVK